MLMKILRSFSSVRRQVYPQASASYANEKTNLGILRKSTLQL